MPEHARHALTGTRSRDRFLAGPLADETIADSAAREAYTLLTHGQKAATSSTESSGDLEERDDEGGIPPRTLLRRTDEVPGLFDYQEDLANQMKDVVLRPSGNNTALLALPTGAGKTRAAIYAVLGLFEAGRVQNVLWLAPSRELLDQAHEALRTLWHSYSNAPNLELLRCHVLGALPPSEERAVYFVTPQMLVARLKKGRRSIPEFDFVVFDEAHFAVAPAFGEAFRQVRQRASGEIPGIGLSATPGRSEEKSTESLVRLFAGRLLTSRLLRPNAIEVLQDRGILSRLEFREIPIAIRLVGQRRVITSREQLSDRTKHLEVDVERFRATIETVARLPAGEKTIVFSASIAHANALYACLHSRGCKVGVLSSRTPLQERDDLLLAFKAGELSVLVNKSILATGYDCPAVSSIVLTMPIGSPVLFEQIVGRASRGPKTGGTSSSTIWQLDDHLAIHGRPASYHRYRDFDWDD